MDKLKSIKKEYYLGLLILALIVIAVVLTNKEDSESILFNSSIESESDETQYYYVDIKGEVNNPGVYKVSSDYRLFQVVNLAGGLTTEADTLAINLSQKIRDELAIYVPAISENYDSVVVVDVEDGMININTASLTELDTLPGVGPSTAQAIIDYRNVTAFEQIEDIMNVAGIGEATYEEIRTSIIT